MYCGVDWAEGHHDIALVDGDGKLIAKRRRIEESPDGVAELTAMPAVAGDSAAESNPVAIETPRRLPRDSASAVFSGRASTSRKVRLTAVPVTP